jgi:DNA helicase-2/ATP-dependent DNA helicase PcrA
LHDLASRDDVTRVPLEKNYRCGEAIIAASLRALGEHRTVVHDRDGGRIEAHRVTGGDDALRARAIELVRRAHDERHVPYEQIALLVPWGYERDRAAEALRAADIPVYARSDRQYRPTPVTMLLEALASWAARRAGAGITLHDVLEASTSTARRSP